VSEFKKPLNLVDSELVDLYDQVKVDPENPEVLLGLGIGLSLREFTNEAVEVLDAARKLAPTDNLIWYELIFACGANDREMCRLEAKIKPAFKDKDSFILMRNLTLFHHYQGNMDKANEYCDKLIDHPDKDYTAYEVIAYLNFWQNKYDVAKQYVRKGLELNDRNIRSWRLLGHCYFEERDYKKAEESYKNCIELNERYVRGWYSLGQLILNDPGRYAEGLQCLSRAISINPHYWNSYFTLINYYLGHKKHTEAMAECLKVIELSKEDNILSEAYNFLGILHYSSQDYRMAHLSFTSALERKPDSAISYYYLGQIDYKNGEPDNALENFEKAMEADPKFAWSYTQSGFALIDKKEYDKAEDRFNRALEVDDKEYWAYMGLADVHRKKRKPKKQLEVMIKALEIEKDDSDVQNRVAIAYECNHNPAEAEKAYLRSLEIDPLNRKAANNLGYLYEKEYLKTKDSAVKEKAIEMWKKRLIICRDTNRSMQGAINHLLKLDVRQSLIDKWIEIGQLNGS